MHELSLIENIIEIVLAEMPKHSLSRVENIALRVGQMRQVVPEALLFGFEVLSKGTVLEGAKLTIEHVPVKGCCRQCGHNFILKDWLIGCPDCEAAEFEIISGKELEIVEFEGS